MGNDPLYIRVNEVSEPLNAIVMAKEFLERSNQDAYNFKWVIIAIHNALQGFMVLALMGTSSLSIIRWKEEYSGKTAYEVLADPDKKLIAFSELFKRIKSKKYMPINEFHGTTDSINNSIKELNRLRNQFIHYLPLGWSIGVQGIAHVLLDSLLVISFLTKDCPVTTRYYSDEDIMNIKKAVDACNSVLLAI